jgi:hypothetical protein
MHARPVSGSRQPRLEILANEATWLRLLGQRCRPYVPVAARGRQTQHAVTELQKQGRRSAPVSASRGAIAKSF